MVIEYGFTWEGRWHVCGVERVGEDSVVDPEELLSRISRAVARGWEVRFTESGSFDDERPVHRPEFDLRKREER